ncbi:hypothetical protein D3C81_2099860 [compost metagenome]
MLLLAPHHVRQCQRKQMHFMITIDHRNGGRRTVLALRNRRTQFIQWPRQLPRQRNRYKRQQETERGPHPQHLPLQFTKVGQRNFFRLPDQDGPLQ